MVPSDRVPALLKWTHESSGHVGADRTLRLFKQWFHTTWSDDQLRKTLQPFVDKCPCRACKPGAIRDRGLYSTLPIHHCANGVFYVDYTEMPKLGGYDFALAVTCGLTRFGPVFPCTKHITGEEIRVLKESVRIWCKTERTRDWVRLLPVISLMNNSQESSATGYSPHELFLGCPAWFLYAPYPEDTHSTVGT